MPKTNCEAVHRGVEKGSGRESDGGKTYFEASRKAGKRANGQTGRAKVAKSNKRGKGPRSNFKRAREEWQERV
jgi:hypothetical protein